MWITTDLVNPMHCWGCYELWKVPVSNTVPNVLQLIRIKEVFPHPNFNASRIELGWDIALIQLDKPTNKTPAPLPSKKFVPKVGKLLVSLGWGSASINLQTVDLVVNATEDCTKAWKKRDPKTKVFSTSFICAWNSTADTCRGE